MVSISSVSPRRSASSSVGARRTESLRLAPSAVHRRGSDLVGEDRPLPSSLARSVGSYPFPRRHKALVQAGVQSDVRKVKADDPVVAGDRLVRDCLEDPAAIHSSRRSRTVVSETFNLAACFQPVAVLVNTYARPAALEKPGAPATAVVFEMAAA